MILVALGTRPELLKIEPLLKYWKSIGFEDWKIWLTCQHEELCRSLKNDWEFSNKVNSSYRIDDFDNRLDDITISIVGSSRFALDRNRPTALLVQGDTASAYACALAAFHRKIPIIHLEAGLRSYDNDNPYPEEFYRRSISMMANVNLCPTEDNKLSLIEERVPGSKFVVGNTILDSIAHIKKSHTPKNYILCTLHRRENLDQIKEWFDVLEALAEKSRGFEFILPIHKNPEIYKYKESFKYVKCVEPLNHDEFIDILKDSACIISDSGGVAEEASWFGKNIFLCRKFTERPEASNFYVFCPTPKDLLDNFTNEIKMHYPFNRTGECPFGDGKASEKITNVLKELKIITV